MLGQHPQIQSENEIFSCFMPRRRGEAPLPTMGGVFSQAKGRRCKPIQLIEIKYLSSQNRGLYPESDLQAWLREAAKHGFNSHILLQRRNGLRRIISHLIAQKTGVYVLRAEETSSSPTKKEAIEINCQSIHEGFETHSLLEWLEIYEASYLKMQETLSQWATSEGCPQPLFLNYEEDLEDMPQIGYAKVCAYLDVTTYHPFLKLRRINDLPLHQLIDNWGTLEALIKPTRFAWMLHQ